MLPAHRTTARLAVAALLAVATACSEQSSPTAVPKLTDASLAAGDNGKVKLKVIHLSANTLKINGPSVDAEFTIYNSGVAIQSGISVKAEIIQAGASREAIPSTPTKCFPSDPDGFLSFANCDMVLPASASNSAAGNGILVEGLATFVMHVYQTVGSATTELSSKSVGINLIGKPSISAFSLASTTLAIGGPSTTWNATLQNPSGTMQNVVLQAYISQNGIRRPAGGLAASCGAAPGNLPNGSCAMSFSTSASGAATPALQVGAATFELVLNQTVGSSTVTLDTKSVEIALVSSAPTLESLEFSSTELVIGGSAVPYTAKIKNPGFPRSLVLIQGEILQDTPAGTVSRGATAWPVQCGTTPLGTLPTTSTDVCVSPANAQALAGPSPSGTLVPGLARFVAHMIHRTSTGDVELATKTIEISLVGAAPTIISIDPTSTDVVLGVGSTSFTTKLQNNGPSLTGVVIQGWISQPTGVRRAAGGIIVQCAGSPGATLPTGTCTTAGDIVASNDPIVSGVGTLAPGAATFELELIGSTGVLYTKSMAITLVAPAISIVSLELSSTTLAIGSTASYTATIVNSSGADLTGILLQGYMEQAPNTQRPANGASANCIPTTPGLVPPGSCVTGFTISVQNSGVGIGVLVPGEATFRLQMSQYGVLLDTKLVTVQLTAASP